MLLQGGGGGDGGGGRDSVQTVLDYRQERERAATKIQAQYRGSHARDKSPERVSAATKLQAQRRGQLLRREQKEKEHAAAKIQAYYRSRGSSSSPSRSPPISPTRMDADIDRIEVCSNPVPHPIQSRHETGPSSF